MKRGGSKTIKIMLKYAEYCLGFGMLQLSNCCLEDLKTWSNCNIGWEGIPLDNGQWKERVFIVVLAGCRLKVKYKGFSFFFAISFHVSDFIYLSRTQFIFHNVH